MSRLFYVSIGDRTLEVDLRGDVPTVDGDPVAADLQRLPGTPLYNLLADGHSFTFAAQPQERKGRWNLEVRGARFSADAVDERTRAIRELTGGEEAEADRTLVAPMPGLVVRVEVAPGDQVAAGQPLVVVEAMKMENELRAPADGTVASVQVAAGQTVDKGDTLLTLE